VPDECFAYSVLLAEAQRHAAAGTAVAYCVEITPVLDGGVDESSTVAVPQDIFCFFPGYLVGIVGHRLQEDVTGGPNQYLGIHRVITVAKYLPAVARPQSDTFSDVYNLLSLRRGKQVGGLPVFTVGVSYPPGQPAEQGYSGALCPEHVEPENTNTVPAIELKRMMHYKITGTKGAVCR